MRVVIADVWVSRVHGARLRSVIRSGVGRMALEEIVTDLSLEYFCDEPREIAAGVYKIDCYMF